MTGKNTYVRGIHILTGMAAIIIIIAGVNLAQSVVVLLLISIFLALIGTPTVLWLERKHIPSLASVAIVVTIMVIVLLMIGALVGTSLKSFSDALPLYQLRIQEQITELETMLTSKGVTGTDKIVLKSVNPETVMSLTASLLADLSSTLSNIVLILLTVIFILLEVSSFPVKLRGSG